MATKLFPSLLTLIRLALALGMLYFLVNSGYINWASLAGLVESWEYTVLAIFLFFIATIFLASRLQVLIHAQQLSLTFMAASKLTFIGLFFNTYLPGSTGGDLVKIYYGSKGNNGRRTEVATVVLLDRFVGLFSLLTLPLMFAPFFYSLILSQPVLQTLLGITFLISAGLVFVTFIGVRYDIDNKRLFQWIEEKVKFGEFLMRVLRIVHSYRVNMSSIYKAIVISWLHQLLMIGVSLAIAQAIIPTGAEWKMVALIPFGYLAIGLPITPGGLGIGEAAMESIFSLNNLSGGAEVILGWRLMMVIVGLLGLFFFLKGEKRFVFNNDDGKVPNQ